MKSITKIGLILYFLCIFAILIFVIYALSSCTKPINSTQQQKTKYYRVKVINKDSTVEYSRVLLDREQ